MIEKFICSLKKCNKLFLQSNNLKSMKANSENSVWSDDFEVSWMEADMQGAAKLSSIFNYLQEVALQHAEKMGFGYETAMGKEQIWVVVRLLIKMKKYPTWRQKIKIKTWPRGLDGIWAFREYIIMDENGSVLGGASSSWLVLNAKTRRPVSPEITFHALPMVNPKGALDEFSSRITPEGEMQVIDQHIIGYSEIDAYQHVNNARYIDWITDALFKYDPDVEVNRFQINYLSEAKVNDVINLKFSKVEDRIFIMGETDQGSTSIFLAELN